MASRPQPDGGRSIRAGISLLEVVIVIVLIAILVGLLAPAIIPPHSDPGQRGQCSSNQRQIVMCMQIYKNQNVRSESFKASLCVICWFPGTT